MKKLLVVLSVICLVITSAFAIDLLEDTEMGNVEGQAGISITQYLAPMTTITSIEGLSWGDDDGCTITGLGGTGAGHLAIRSATLTGTQSQLVMGVVISSAQPIRMDVDAAGIYLAMAGLTVTVSTPPRMQFSVSGNVANDFAGVTQSASTRVLGDLATDGVVITVITPSVMRIAPH